MPTGWNPSEWGLSSWGPGAEQQLPAYPTIIALDPTEEEASVAPSRPIHVRITDEDGIRSDGIHLGLNGIYLVSDGVAVNGATLIKTANDGNGYDIIVTPPFPYPNASRQEVIVIAVNNKELVTSKLYYFHVGIGLRVLSVTNDMDGLLRVFFSRPLAHNGEFFDINNWAVDAVTEGALPVTVTRVASSNGQQDQALLSYEGGGPNNSTYRLTVKEITGVDGEEIEEGYDSVLFNLIFAQEADAVVRFFDSAFGTIGLLQQEVTRRTIDTHMADRAMAVASEAQMDIKYKTHADRTQTKLGSKRI